MFHFVGFFILSLHAYVHVCIFEVFECIFLSPEYLRTRSFFIVAFVQVIKFRNIDYNTIVCSTDYIKISPNSKCLSSLYSQSNIQPTITDSIYMFCLFIRIFFDTNGKIAAANANTGPRTKKIRCNALSDSPAASE